MFKQNQHVRATKKSLYKSLTRLNFVKGREVEGFENFKFYPPLSIEKKLVYTTLVVGAPKTKAGGGAYKNEESLPWRCLKKKKTSKNFTV